MEAHDAEVQALGRFARSGSKRVVSFQGIRTARCCVPPSPVAPSPLSRPEWPRGSAASGTGCRQTVTCTGTWAPIVSALSFRRMAGAFVRDRAASLSMRVPGASTGADLYGRYGNGFQSSITSQHWARPGVRRLR